MRGFAMTLNVGKDPSLAEGPHGMPSPRNHSLLRIGIAAAVLLAVCKPAPAFYWSRTPPPTLIPPQYQGKPGNPPGSEDNPFTPGGGDNPGGGNPGGGGST